MSDTATATAPVDRQNIKVGFAFALVAVVVLIAAFGGWMLTPSPPPSAKIAAEVDFLKSHNGTEPEICDAETRLADAYAKEQSPDFKTASITARMHCLSLALENRLKAK
jgi:hypothetical protein